MKLEKRIRLEKLEDELLRRAVKSGFQEEEAGLQKQEARFLSWLLISKIFAAIVFELYLII